jgi:hypothetical protein
MVRGEAEERGIDAQRFVACGEVFRDMFLVKTAQIQIGPFQIRRKLDGLLEICLCGGEVALLGLEDALKIIESAAARSFS